MPFPKSGFWLKKIIENSHENSLNNWQTNCASFYPQFLKEFFMDFSILKMDSMINRLQ
jgi:hypothetical protein